MSSNSASIDRFKGTQRTALLLVLGAFFLFFFLRIPSIGHLLTWDEAMNICTVRSMASHGSDDFSNWFWRHPPLYPTLMLLLSPLKDGFIARVEAFNIGLCSINLFLLFLVNRRFFGTLAGAASIFLLAVMPGSIFFDLWVKRDHLAVTFALLSLLLLLRHRYGVAALMAGLGFLCKETFIFLYIPIFLYAALQKESEVKLWIKMLIMTIIPALTSCWWFIIASHKGPLSSISQHVEFALAPGQSWYGGITFYASLITTLTTPLGMLLLAAGVLVTVAAIKPNGIRALIWPLSCIILPLLLLSLLPRKVPWIVITLLPAIATAQAVAVCPALEALHALRRNTLPASILTLLAMGLFALPSLRYDSESMLKSVSPHQYRGATRSRMIAESASSLISDSDRLLLSSFYYWEGVVPGQMCPVFTCYFKRKPAILPVDCHAPFEELVQLISEYRLNWAIVSPPPGDIERDVLGGFMRDAGLRPANLGHACIFNTAELLKEPESTVLDEIPEPLE